jgi:hypothetical protein
LEIYWNVPVKLFNVVRFDVVIEIVVFGVERKAPVAELED